MWAPSSSARARKSSVATSSRTASAAAQATGLPPNVRRARPGAARPSPRRGRSPRRAGARRRATCPRRAGPARSVVLDRPDRPRTPDARLHLVVHIENAALPAQLGEAPREVARHLDEAAFALHRLEDDAGDLVRIEQLGHGFDRRVRRNAAVRVRRRRAINLRSERAEAPSCTSPCASSSSSAESAHGMRSRNDDAGSAGRCARDLDGVLDGLRAGVQEQALLVARPRRDSSASRRQTSTYGS